MMATQPLTNLIDPPPRLTGDAGQDTVAVIQWLNAFYVKGVLSGGLLQPQNLAPALISLGALPGAADMLAYYVAEDTFDLTGFTAFARTLLEAVDAAAARLTLGLGTLATKDAVDLSTAEVTGNLPVAHLNSGTGAGATTFWRGDATWGTPAGAGDVVGPAGATSGRISLFDGVTGKLIKQIGSSGTTTTLLHGNAAGDPTWAAVDLTNDVTGDLAFSNLAQGSALSVLGVAGNATADVASIAAASDHQVLRRSGTSVAFGSVDLSQAAATTGQLASTRVDLPKIGTVTGGVTLDRDFTTRGSAGVIDGTLTYLSVGSAANKVTVAAGEGYIRTTNDQQGTLVFCSWAQSVDAVTMAAPAAGQETARFIGIEYNAGTPQVTVRTTFNWNWFDDFPLGRVSYDGTTMRILNAYAHSEDTANLTRKFLRLTMPFQREESPEGTGGVVAGETGTRNITLSAGALWHGFNRYTVGAVNTAVSGTVDLWYASGGGFLNSGASAQWPNGFYNNAGVLTALGANKYVNLWVYVDVSDGTMDIIYGTAQYNTTAAALLENAPSSVPGHLQYHGRLVARWVVKQGAATIDTNQSAWTTLLGSTNTTDHTQLSNLAWTSSGHTGTASKVAGFNGSGAAAELAIGTDIQAYDADLVTWAGITPGANVGTALAVAVGTDGAFVVKGGALGSPSSAGTIPAFTLGGDIAGSFHALNNGYIGFTFAAASNDNVININQVNAGGNGLDSSALQFVENRGSNSLIVQQNNGTTTFKVAASGAISTASTITSTIATGTAPLTITSTTEVANLNVAALKGATWTAPGTIGSGTPNTGAFTTVAASGAVTRSGAHGAGSFNAFVLKNSTAGTTFSGKIVWVDGNGNEGWSFGNNVAVGSGYLEFNEAGTNRGYLLPGGTLRLSAYGAGAATFDASGNITSVSDESIKDRIKPYNAGLDEIVSLSKAGATILHGYRDDSGLDTEGEYAGFNAGIVEKILPHAVGRMNGSRFTLGGIPLRGHRTFTERPIVAALVNAIAQIETRLSKAGY